MKPVAAAVAAAILLLGVAALGEAHPSSAVPLHHWAYRAIGRFVALGLVPAHLVAAKPLTRGEFAALVEGLTKAADRSSLSQSDRELIEALREEFADEIAARRGGPPAPLRFRLGVRGGIGAPPTLSTHPDRRPGVGATATVVGGAGRVGLSGVLELTSLADSRASFGIQLGPVGLQLGREELWWGPGTRGALLLSDNAGPMSLVKLTWMPLPTLRFTKFAAALDAPGRYLFGTRIDWAATGRLRIGLAETAVAFPSPLLWYHLVNPLPAVLTDLLSMPRRQTTMGANDNFVVSLDAEYLVRPGVLVYGEQMQDDIHSVQPLLEGWRLFPRQSSKWGLTAGVYLADPFRTGRTDLRIEYTRLVNWTYTHTLPSRAYTLRGRSLGHWLGPDADDLAVMVTHTLGPSVTVGGWVAVTRHGEGRITRPRSGGIDIWANYFLSGVVETRTSLGASWERRTPAGTLGLVAELSQVRNRMNVSGRDGPEYFVGLTYERSW